MKPGRRENGARRMTSITVSRRMECEEDEIDGLRVINGKMAGNISSLSRDV